MKKMCYHRICSDEQTVKALALGAPFSAKSNPTTDDLLGWFRREKNIYILPFVVDGKIGFAIHKGMENDGFIKETGLYNSYTTAEFVAIDMALDYVLYR